METRYSRPLQHRALAFLLLLLLALGILGGMIWRNLHHFNTLLSHVNYSHSVQYVSIELQQTLITYLNEAVKDVYPQQLPQTMVALHKTIKEIDDLIADDALLAADTRTSMESVKKLLANSEQLEVIDKNQQLINALQAMSKALDNEVLARDQLLESISNDTETELYLASITFSVIVILAVLFFHRRIMHPLNDLRLLLQRLTEESYIPFSTAHLDPLILPVFKSYNEMVKHLAELEEANRSHAQSLQKEVRIATQALLEQQHTLARAERLAAIGEVAAELAHEIRNPLAGIQMAFNNLRREIADVAQGERIELISSELKRLTKLLNEILDKSRHTPEAVSEFDLADLIKNLVALTRYQIAERIQIQINVPNELNVKLPESGVRQALLNLLLNAGEALEDQGGEIWLQAFKEEPGITIVVRDNGPGFSQEMLANGIRTFRTSRQRGTGLGLAMVLRFVTDMGGTVSLANQQPQGACVTLHLPNSCFSGESK